MGTLELTADLMVAFLLVLARVSGVIALAPFPGTRLFPPAAKIVFSLLLAGLLVPQARLRGLGGVGAWTLSIWVLREAGLGVSVGAALQLLAEMLSLAAQLLGFQAGYSYINTIDPATQVDATILNVLLTLLGGSLFFVFDLHLQIIRALAVSLEKIPVGEFALRPRSVPALVHLGASVFETAIRLSFPVVALLLLLDLALTLLSYVNARLQLLTLSFTIKILMALAGLYVISQTTPRLFQALGRQALEVIHEVTWR